MFKMDYEINAAKCFRDVKKKKREREREVYPLDLSVSSFG